MIRRHIVKIEGDEALGARWVPFAKRKLHWMRDFETKFFEPQAGVLVRVRRLGEEGYIHIVALRCSITLDHGLIKPGDTSLSNTARFEPGHIYYGTNVREYVQTPVIPTFFGSVRFPGGHNRGDNLLVDGAVAKCVEPPRDESGAYIQTEALPAKKRALAEVPASLWSGKLRLYVQAQYGRHFANGEGDSVWKWTPTYGYGEPSITHEVGFTLHLQYGLYTDDEWHYWLIEAKAGSPFRVYRLKLSPCGETVRQFLSARSKGDEPLSSDQLKRLEAYVLSEATPDPTFTFELGNNPAGPAAAYGWKFNWAGTEAHIVSLETDTSTIGDRYITTLWRARFSRDRLADVSDIGNDLSEPQRSIAKEKARWTLLVEQLERQYFQPAKSQASFWAPAWFEQKLALLVPSTSVDYDLFDQSDVAFYCFYDETDTLHVCRYSFIATPGSTENYNTNPGCHSSRWIGPVSMEVSTRSISASSTSTVNIGTTSVVGTYYGYSYGGVKYTFQYETIEYEKSACDTCFDGVQSVCNTVTNNPICYNDTSACAVAAAMQAAGAAGYRTDRVWVTGYRGHWLYEAVPYSTVNGARRIAVIIPYYDCEALYVAQGGYVIENKYVVQGTAYRRYKFDIYMLPPNQPAEVYTAVPTLWCWAPRSCTGACRPTFEELRPVAENNYRTCWPSSANCVTFTWTQHSAHYWTVEYGPPGCASGGDSVSVSTADCPFGGVPQWNSNTKLMECHRTGIPNLEYIGTYYAPQELEPTIDRITHEGTTNVRTDEPTILRLINRHGVFDCSVDGLTAQLLLPSLSYPFYDDDFNTRTSVFGDVFGEGLALRTGYSVDDDWKDSFVGWA